MKKLLVIIPAYNEEKSILDVVNSVKCINSDYCLINYIVVNDCSTDGTKDVLIKNNIDYLDLSSNLGIGGAVQTGYKYALYNKYDYVIQVDGDGQHDVNYIESMINEMEKGVDMVIGSRFVSNLSKFQSTKIRRIGIKWLSFLIKVCTGKRIYDPTSGFRIINKKVLKLFANDYPVDYPEPESVVTVIKKGYKINEIPVKMNKRKHGKSSINFLKSHYYIIKISLLIIISAINTKKEIEK